MAIDSIKIYIERLRSKVNIDGNCYLEEAIFLNGFTGFKFTVDPLNANLSYYCTDIDGIYIKYFPYCNNGELRIKFNIPKLMAGTNIMSVFKCNTQQLFERLCFRLWPVIDLKRGPHLRFWKVSMLENNIDVIMDKCMIEALYSVIRKTSRTDRFKNVLSYNSGGKTKYYIPIKAKFKSSDIVIKFYLKVPELKEDDHDFDINDIYGSSGIVNLKPHQDILRIEITKYRDDIYNDFKPIIIGSGYSNESLVRSRKAKCESSIGTFEQVFNLEYQCNMMSGVLKAFNLNKTTTTKDVLYDLIDSMASLSKDEKKEGKRVIQYLNKKLHKTKPKLRDIKLYKDFILAAGYNYIYADIELDPISIAGVIGSLPEVQQIEIALYKNNNIYKDVALSMLPNPRVYMGKHY